MKKLLIFIVISLIPTQALPEFSLKQFALDVGTEILSNSADLGPKKLCQKLGGEIVSKLICDPLIDSIIKQAPELAFLKNEEAKPDDFQAKLAAKLITENKEIQQAFLSHIENLNTRQQSLLYGEIKDLRQSVKSDIAKLRAELLAQNKIIIGKVDNIEKQITVGNSRSKIIVSKVSNIEQQMTVNNNRSRMISDLRAFSDTFIDGSSGPLMIPVPGGKFYYGNQEDDTKGNHRVRHKINVNRFAISQYEITFEQYNLFARSTGRDEKFKGCLPTDRPAYSYQYGSDVNPCPSPQKYFEHLKMPVFWVTFEEAQAYAQWISDITGINYRLPSHAEWQYASLAGKNKDFYWERGFNNILYKNKIYENIYFIANLCTELPTYKHPDCYFEKLKPIGQYPANPWGLYDMVGNVSEWTLDCPPKDEKSFQEQTKNGGAVTDCWPFMLHERIHAGGSIAQSMTWDKGWLTQSTLGDSMFEVYSHNANNINQFIGIRLAREIQ